jgi:hypothetical protein
LDEATTTDGIMGNTSSVSSPSAYEVCQSLLQDAAGPNYDPAWLPDAPNREYSELLSQPKEVFGPDFIPPCAPEQVAVLRRDRNQFTAAEDSLVFRGVVCFFLLLLVVNVRNPIIPNELFIYLFHSRICTVKNNGY